MKPKIFAVEDDDFFVKVLRITLKGGGYELVGVAPSGEDALQQIEILHPDLVLMDMSLSGRLDGIDTADRIRTKSALPVIFLTGSDDQSLLHRAKHTEPFGYLAKPFREQDLVSAIEIALYKHQSEHKLKQREAWLATTLQCVGEGMIVTDAAGRIEFVNEIAKRILCIRDTEIIGRKFSDIVSLKSRLTGAVAGDLVQLAILQSGTMNIGKDLTVVGSSKGDAELEGEISVSQVEGTIAGTVFTFRDATIRHHEEEQYRQGLRKRAVAQFAGALSNELKQVQQTALAGAQTVLDQVKAGQPIHLAVGTMKTRCLDALARVLHQLTVLRRKEPSFPRALDLNGLIAETLRDLRTDIPSRVELVSELSPELGDVLADQSHLKQAITSLILYLRDSLSKGEIFVATRNCGLELRARTTQVNQYTRLVIGSRSTVIDIEHAKENESFGPFSGVDPLSEKLDLRLFTVYGIIADARGSISAQTKSGHSMTFEIVLPQGPAKNEQQSMVSAVESLPDAPAVLLIEKDNDIRNLVLTGLEERGFEALGARNAQEAVEWIDLYASPIALLITQLDIAAMTGMPLAERIMLRHPRMRALFIINNAVDSVLCERWKNLGSRFLEHPFRLTDLLGVVNEMLVPGDSNNLQPEFSSFGCLSQ